MPVRYGTTSDSETERKVSQKHSSKKDATPAKEVPPDDQGDEVEVGEGGEEEEEEEEEYEIEAILDAKRGTFPEGRMGYLVKWKGYDESHNSWVDEMDAVNATDLIEAFSAQKKKVGRKSLQKANKSPAAREGPPKSEARKKRGRPSKDKSDEEESEDEKAARSAKRAKKAAATTVNRPAPKNTRTSASSEPDELLIDGLINMKKWMDLDSWEELVEQVDTIEREDGKDLSVYFTLTTGERSRQPSELCTEKFPRKMIRFYESHLRWLEAGEPPSS